MPIDVKAYRQKEPDALRKELSALQRKLFDLRTQGVVEKLEDTSQLKKTRRDIARLKTLLHERELAISTT
jgi:large subunit ribosomal protein L29